MKSLVKTTVIAAAALVILPGLSSAGYKSIYGDDNRLDYFAASGGMQTLSDSVVSFWEASSIETLNPGGVKLKTVNFGDRMKLCPAEKFREQPIGAFCSGSLVGPDLVMTAGHCVTTEEECKNTKLVFGYAIKTEGAAAVTAMPSSEVYTCSKIVTRFLGGEPGSVNPAGQTLGPDYALIQLDRKVTGHKPLAINRGTALKAGDAVFVIGHPVGLPLKIADGARVRDFSKTGYFTADLDTFGGNSGSPVFNARTNLIEGILVRGDTDFVKSPAGCTTMATYSQTGGRGEDVTKVSSLASFIPSAASKEADAEAAGEAKVIGVDSSEIPQVQAPAKELSFD